MEMSFDLKEVYDQKHNIVEPSIQHGMISAPELFRNILGDERYEKIIEQTNINQSNVDIGAETLQRPFVPPSISPKKMVLLQALEAERRQKLKLFEP